MERCCECEERYAIVKLQKDDKWKDFCLVCAKEEKRTHDTTPVIFDKSVHELHLTDTAIDDELKSFLFYPFEELKALEDKFTELATLQNQAVERDHQVEARNIRSMKQAIVEQLQSLIKQHT